MTSSATRRELLSGLGVIGAAALGTGLPNLPAEAAGPGFGRGARSGLAWNSGAGFGNHLGFEAWRRRKCDTITIWHPRETWTSLLNFDRSGGFNKVKGWPQRISMGFAPLPNTHSAVKNPGNWKLAARGEFDHYYQAISQKLASYGRRDMIIRIGWESNHTFPWYAGSDPKNFKETWKRIAGILRRHNPTVLLDWTNVKKGQQKHSVLEHYPGDDYVDIIGVDYYDAWPAHTSEKVWNDQFNKTFQGGPWGLGAWLDFAKSRGKRLSCPEWGIFVGNSPGSTDNPFYIRKMYEFFSKNAAHIAYENYFDQKDYHRVSTPTRNGKASAEYLRLYRT